MRTDHILPIGVIGALTAIWEVTVRLANIPLYILPAPTDVAGAMVTESANLIHHGAVTLLETALGLGAAMVLGLVLGIMMDRYVYFKKAVYPMLVISQNIPIIVLAPLFVIYLGFGIAPKLAVVILMCFFPIAVNLTDSFASVNPGQINLARTFGAEVWQVYFLVKLPGAAQGFFSGLRVAATYSITGAVVGEWLSSKSGLGYYMLRVKNAYMLDRVFACILCIVILSLAMNGIVKVAEYCFMPGVGQRRKEG